MHGHSKTPREGVPGNAGHFDLDWASATATAPAAQRATVAAHGPRLQAGARSCCLDAC